MPVLRNDPVSRYTIVLIALMLCVCKALIAQHEVFTVYTMDRPLLLPPYPALQLEEGVSGLVEIDALFDNGRVTSANVVRTHIISSKDYENEYKVLLDRWGESLVKIVTQWQTYLINQFSAHIVIEYKRDDSLKPNMRIYNVEYDVVHDVPSKVMITGPVLESKK